MHLNVRDRRIEAKIAYIGPLGAGKATNLVKLGAADMGDSIELDWRPESPTRFRDCDVFVKLVADRGSPTAESVRDALRDADGVVFVADADPDAQPRNRASLALVREALAETSRKGVALVVQVNKRDLAGALPPEDVIAGLSAADLPHVVASATQGDGVVETAERILERVLQAMESNGPETPDAKPLPRVEGNPLLTALRQVLRDTVAEHIEQMEARTHAKLERIVASADGDGGAMASLEEQVRALQAAVSALASRETSTTPTPVPAATRDGMVRSLDALTEQVAAQRAEAAATTEQLDALLELVREMNDDMKRKKWGWFR